LISVGIPKPNKTVGIW